MIDGNSNIRDAIDRIVQFANVSPQTIPGGNAPFVVIPEGSEVKSLEHLLPPARIKRMLRFQEAGSFADYVNKFKMPATLLFVSISETGCSFTAMLDYHEPAPDLKPAYCEHVATFTAIETPEWKAWKAADRKRLGQVEFAEWLEDNLKLFVKPTGAELLELVTSLHGHNNARFNTALRLANGGFSCSYDEDVTIKGASSTTGGEIELPPTISAGIAVFQGAAKYEVSARLKSRIEDRKLQLYFETISKEEIVRESILLLTQQISEKTGIVPLIGNP